MVDVKEVVIPPIWEKVDIFLKLQDDAGNPLSGISYVIYTDHEERVGQTNNEGVIEEKGVAGKDYFIELEDGNTIVFEESPDSGSASDTEAVAEDGTDVAGSDEENLAEDDAVLEYMEDYSDNIDDMTDEGLPDQDYEEDVEEE